MSDEPRTRDAILGRFRKAYTAFDAALAKLTDQQMLAPGPGGGWSARDVLAHVGADHLWYTGQMTALLEGREPNAAECYGDVPPPGPGHDLSTQDGRNRLQLEQNRDVPLDEVRRRYRANRDRLEAIMERLPDDQMEQPYAIAVLGFTGQVRPAAEGEQGFPLWQWLRGNTWHHYEDHLKDIEAAPGR
jgi:hypothetical protein